MAYKAKTDWLPDDLINEDDVNRWEKGIKDAHQDLATHKNDLNNPHGTTKAQIGLGNVEDVRQASKKNFSNMLAIQRFIFQKRRGQNGMPRKHLMAHKKKQIVLKKMPRHMQTRRLQTKT